MVPFALSVIQALSASGDDWIKDGAPCLNNELTVQIKNRIEDFRSARKRHASCPRIASRPADTAPSNARRTSATTATTAQRRRNMAFCNQASKIDAGVAERFKECNRLGTSSNQLQRTLMETAAAEDVKAAGELLTSCEDAMSSSAVGDAVGRLFQMFARLAVVTSRTRADSIAYEAIAAGKRPGSNGRVDDILSRGLRAMADLASMCELMRDLRTTPLSSSPEQPFTQSEQFLVGHSLATLFRNLPLLAMKNALGQGSSVRPCNAQDARASMATLLRDVDAQREASNGVHSLARRMAGWRNLREQVTSTVVCAFEDMHDRTPEFTSELRSSFEFCSDVLPVMTNALRQLRDELEFEWSSSVERTATERDALKFLVAFIEHEEFMTHATTAMAEPWLDKKSMSHSPVNESAATAATAPATVAASPDGAAPPELNVAMEKAARPPDMSKAQWGRLKKKLEREALEAQKLRAKLERANRKAASAESTPVGQVPVAMATSTTSAATAEIAASALPGSTRSDAGSVTTVSLPSRTLADLKAGTTDLNHSEFLMKRWSGIREALDQAEIHCHARYCSTREFREIEGAEAATTRAREALGRAQADLRDADLVLAQSPHREQLKAEHRPHAAKHSDLTAKVRAMEARVEAVAAAKPLLTAQEFIDQWLSGGFELSPVRGDTRIAHDTRGRPLCKILARPTQDLGGYSQQHMQIHFHMDRRSTAEYGHQVRASDLRMVGGCPIVSVKLGRHEYTTGPGFFRLWFNSEQIRHLTDMLARAFPAEMTISPSRPKAA